MKPETLKQANELQRKINELTEALNSFYFTFGETPDMQQVSREPTLIVERIADYWEGRETVKLPISVQGELQELIIVKLQAALDQTKQEFNDL